jgi:membrane protease YdiL (CAAX protease family)
MKTPRYTLVLLAAIVAAWYLLTTLPRQLLGTCVDGECGFSAGEIVLSIALPLLALAFTVGAEMRLAGSTPRQALADLGVTRLHWPAVGLAALTVLPLLAFYPLYSLITTTPLALAPGWPWLLLGALLYNGVNEETMFRGLVFRRLRQDRTFWRAATLSVVIFAGAHIPSIFTFNPVVGIVSIILAIPTGYLLAYLYERGRGTIWGCVLFHAANNGIPFIIALAPDAQLVAASLYMLVGMVVSGGLMLWVFRATRGTVATHPAQAGSQAAG